MTNVQINALFIYNNNVRETRAHFLAQEDALRASYLSSSMDCLTFDRLLDGIKAQLAHFLNEEANLYRLNLSSPLDMAA